MVAEAPTILATSGGLRPGDRTTLEFAPLSSYAVELAGVTGRAPRVVYLGTATGDQDALEARMAQAARVAGWDFTPLRLFMMPNTDDVRALLLGADVIWVMGGSVANLLALWRLHGWDAHLREAWEAGVVLTGVSAGSICWFTAGTTDSFGPALAPVTNGLGLLPYGNGVHYDSEPRRRPLVHELVASGTIPTTHCTDDGAGLLYRGTELVEAVSERPSAGAYVVRRDVDAVVEEQLPTRLLTG